MPNIDSLTDAELGRLIRAASRASGSLIQENARALDTFCAWLDTAGFGWLSASIKSADLAWDGIKWLYHRIFA